MNRNAVPWGITRMNLPNWTDGWMDGWMNGISDLLKGVQNNISWWRFDDYDDYQLRRTKNSSSSGHPPSSSHRRRPLIGKWDLTSFVRDIWLR